MAAAGFRWPVRVYYEDTDAGGVVYHANYLRFLERARTERLRALGFDLDELRREHGVLFVVRALELEFLKPARFNDALLVTAEFGEVRAARLELAQAVTRGEDETLCRARVQLVCVAADRFRPAPLPEPLARCLRKGGG
ncbi:tol-pal system-associated acyl-CoA thioesterase [Candidatus Methylocalor cossyra]|uniref:Esterase/thioesterase n=1 Tax=Candidatus Methylocalor cossyra TaxID=3108543 RepID=A0ABP1CCA0_9GAMM